MSKPVLLQDIVDELQMQLDESSSYLDLDTGEVVTVSHDLLHKAEEAGGGDAEEPDDLLAWQEQEWEIAKRVVSTDRFKALPSKFDVHEWSIMEDFVRSLESAKIRDDLEHAIHGAGAFRHFKATIHRHRIEQSWYDFRDEALREIAIEWCEEHEISWR